MLTVFLVSKRGITKAQFLELGQYLIFIFHSEYVFINKLSVFQCFEDSKKKSCQLFVTTVLKFPKSDPNFIPISTLTPATEILPLSIVMTAMHAYFNVSLWKCVTKQICFLSKGLKQIFF